MATTMMVVPLIPPVILPTGVRVDIKKYFQISRWCLCYGDTLISVIPVCGSSDTVITDEFAPYPILVLARTYK